MDTQKIKKTAENYGCAPIILAVFLM